jgi:hypothetical protein
MEAHRQDHRQEVHALIWGSLAKIHVPSADMYPDTRASPVLEFVEIELEFNIVVQRHRPGIKINPGLF